MSHQFQPPISSLPKSIAVIGNDLALAWSDGTEQFISLLALRKACPCAVCEGEPDVMENLSLKSTETANNSVAPVFAPSTPHSSLVSGTVKTGFKIALKKQLTPESFVLKKYEFVGGYGIQFFWGDGHSTGIYSAAYLRGLE